MNPLSFRLAACALLAAAATAAATELVYVPVNPAFGGIPANGTVLLGSASATNKHPPPAAQGAGGIGQQTPLEQFNGMLERSILNQLSMSAASKISTAGHLVPGKVETANFTIEIVDLGGGLLKVTTTDKVTGQSTSFQVGQ